MGYNRDISTKLHRIIEYNGREFYSEYDMGIGYSYAMARYHLEYKWRPGFNDYPVGEKFNYREVKVVEEWISGSFTQDFSEGRVGIDCSGEELDY